MFSGKCTVGGARICIAGKGDGLRSCLARLATPLECAAPRIIAAVYPRLLARLDNTITRVRAERENMVRLSPMLRWAIGP